jgi:hypothetical protein
MRQRTHSEDCVEHGYSGARGLVERSVRSVRQCRSPADAAAATSLTANDPVPLLERAFSFAVLALLFLLGGILLHGIVLGDGLGEVCGAKRSSDDWTCVAGQAPGDGISRG